ncbi:sensor histidine kinase [Pedobacter sp. MR2016-24]|uniref:sensor histidine kinase n=1 Tax=Pedobacter sp. MR2016-24 TaxID=2994466 RepID=UPI0022469810|nr:histidine kinase [Pedobacter sp. MR2016-24]MCX2482783.1 histidine kinase [Pedobacter sp. MR2016-24]
MTSIYLANIVWRGSYFMLYGTGYYFLIRYNQKKERTLKQAIENEKLENSLLRAEQDFLRAQINPHLLFNSLNFIRYAIRKRPAEADDAIMRLAGMMGFALESTTGTIPLSRELEQIDNLIALNQLRFNHTLYLNYSTEIHDPETPTIPIILLTLVENVFKHGNLRDEKFSASIKIESTPAYLLFESSNLAIEKNSVKSNKTGIQNISLRLDQFYKNQYRFSHELHENIYKVELKIDYPPK